MIKFSIRQTIPCLFLCCLLSFDASAQRQENSLSESYQLEMTYTGDLFANITGGLNTGIRYMDNFDISLDLDLEKAIGLNRSELFIYGLGNQGGSISELTGDVQGVSNIEAENSWRLYEAWFQHINNAETFSVLFGLYDLNTEFDVAKTGVPFLNSSHGMGAEFAASGVLGPSTFPYTSLGGRVKWIPQNDWLIKAAVLDGVPSDPGSTRGTKIFLRENDGALIAAELSYFPGNGNDLSAKYNHLGRGVENPESYRVAIGAWGYTKSRDGWLDDSTHDTGLYGILEGNLYEEPDNDDQGLNGFVRLGFANQKANRFTAYSGAGLVYTGPFENRENDQFGLAVAIPWGSGDYETILENQGLQPTAFEMNVEAMYLFITSSFINLQLDAQYIVNPNTLKSVDNAFVLGTRMQLTF